MTRNRITKFLASFAVADRECLHRTRYRHVKETALFIDRSFDFRTTMRQQAIFQTDYVHVRILEAFATVHRDQRDRIAGPLLLFSAFAVQREVIEKSFNL